MSDPKVVLCADAESMRNPEFIGLEGESLESQSWLRVFCSALEARSYLKTSPDPQEVWVASSDEVDSLNLAAALKKDSSGRGVYLVAFEGSGSQKSRASAAGVDGSLSRSDFIKRYTKYKQGGDSSSTTQPMAAVRHSDSSDATLTSPRKDEREQESPKPQTPIIAKASPGKLAHVLTVVSASGGSGKSTIATLSALFAQGLGHRTLLIDADLQFGDTHILLGEEQPITIDQALQDQRLFSRLTPQGMRPAFLGAPPCLEQSESLSEEVPRLLDLLRPQFDVIVINTGAFWTDLQASLLEKSSNTLFLVDQRPSSVRACKHALDLCARCGIATHPFIFALNRCARNEPLTSIDVSCALQGAHVVELQEGGREVADLLGAGMPFELIDAHNALCLSIERMLLDLLPDKGSNSAEGTMSPKKKRFRFGRKRRRVACL